MSTHASLTVISQYSPEASFTTPSAHRMRRHWLCDLVETPVAKTSHLADDKGNKVRSISFRCKQWLTSFVKFFLVFIDRQLLRGRRDRWAASTIVCWSWYQCSPELCSYAAIQIQILTVKEAFEELVILIALHLPQDASILTSCSLMAAKKHYYCTTCSQLLGYGEVLRLCWCKDWDLSASITGSTTTNVKTRRSGIALILLLCHHNHFNIVQIQSYGMLFKRDL